MLDKIIQTKTEKKEVVGELNSLREKLSGLETAIKGAKQPVIITIDGWSASGKGSQISQLIKCLDPRFYKVVSVRVPSQLEKRKPWLWKYATIVPKQGNFLILDRSWYRDTVNAYMYGEISKEEMKKRFDEINVFERQLADDGYLVLKFFLHITKKEQQKRIEKLQDSSITKWRIDHHDITNMNNYDKFEKLYEQMFSKTNTSSAVWHIVPSNDKTTAQMSILKTITTEIAEKIKAKESEKTFVQKSEFELAKVDMNKFKMSNNLKLSDVKLDKEISEEEYETKLKKYQDRLFKLQNLCYQKKIPVIICYEGWDAGGKGGNIKRVANALDPRGYEVEPIAAPEPNELARHYLYRFWTRLENDGHFTIFDRTWYGRVMVEPIEKITSENRVEQAYQEINEFEKMLNDWGAVVIKFWIQIDKDEQLRRFTERQNTPEKQWKITDEDWRNRDKWDTYEKYIDKMIEKTSTEFAPWVIVEGNDKKYARIKALKTIIKRIEKKLDEI